MACFLRLWKDWVNELTRKSSSSRVEWHQNRLDWMILNKIIT